MGYDIFKFGALYLDDKIQLVPQQPNGNGDIPQYDRKSAISIEATAKKKSITWIKPAGFNLLIADRVLLSSVTWKDLDKNSFTAGKTIWVDGQHFRCRLLQVGEGRDIPNEWDKALDETGVDNSLWHWKNIYFWGANTPTKYASYRAVRGYRSARTWDIHHTSTRYAHIGFRPALEPLGADNPIPNINLDGVDFQLNSLPEGDGFCPVLQPTQESVFKDIPDEGRVRMYTFLEGGKPIHVGATVKDTSKLTLTDRYFGDEFLIPWVISNGIAIASQSMKQQI